MISKTKLGKSTTMLFVASRIFFRKKKNGATGREKKNVIAESLVLGYRPYRTFFCVNPEFNKPVTLKNKQPRPQETKQITQSRV